MIIKHGKNFVIKEIIYDDILNVYADDKPYALIAVNFPLDCEDKMAYGYKYLDSLDKIESPTLVKV